MVSAREVAQTRSPTPDARPGRTPTSCTRTGTARSRRRSNTATAEGEPDFTSCRTSRRSRRTRRSTVPTATRSTSASATTCRSSSSNTGRQRAGLPAGRAGDAQPYYGNGRHPDRATSFQRAMFALASSATCNLLISGQISSRQQDHDQPRHRRRGCARPRRSSSSTPTRTSRSSTGARSGSGTRTRTTDQYPYSQEVDLAQATVPTAPTTICRAASNYIRNSVKVVVDAYDGTVTYYADLQRARSSRSWSTTPSPGLFTPITGARRSSGALPVPGEPVPGPGDPVRQLPRDRPVGLLPEARLLGRSRPTRRSRNRRTA